MLCTAVAASILNYHFTYEKNTKMNINWRWLLIKITIAFILTNSNVVAANSNACDPRTGLKTLYLVLLINRFCI